MKVYIKIKRKSRIPIIAGICLCICFITALIFTKDNQKDAEAAETISFDEDADFCVLEIVPYHGMGEFGYLVGGEEPIDLDNAELNKDVEKYKGPVTSLLSDIVEWDEYYYHKTRLDPGETASEYNIGTKSQDFCKANKGTDKIVGDGYYERVEPGMGLYKYSNNYQLVEGKKGTHVADVDYFTNKSKGDYELGFSYQDEIDWDGTSTVKQWGSYVVDHVTKNTSNRGDYTDSYEYLKDTKSSQGKYVKFVKSTKDTTSITKYSPVEISADASFNGEAYYTKHSNGDYEFVESGAGESYVKFVEDKNGAYVAEEVDESKLGAGKSQLAYAQKYRYVNKKGSYDVTFTKSSNTDKNETLYYIRKDYIVNQGNGNYSVVCKKDKSGNNLYIESDQGDYVASFEKATGNDRTGADFVWVDCKKQDYVESPEKATEIGYTIYFENHARDLIYFYRSSYKNLEKFKKRVLLLSDKQAANYKVDVLSLTPEEVNANQQVIKQADLYYISPTTHNTEYVKLYEKFGRKKDTEKVKYASHLDKLPNFYERYTNNKFNEKKSNDLTWKSVYTIFEQVTQSKKGLFMDCTIYSSYTNYWVKNVKDPSGKMEASGTSNNIAKLYLMCMQREPKDFYNTYFLPTSNPNIEVEGKDIKDEYTGFTVNTGYFDVNGGNSRTKTYWNNNTFLPGVPNGESNPEKYYKDHGIGNPYVTEHEALTNVHDTVGTFRSNISMNHDLNVDQWTDDELLEYIKERDKLDHKPSIANGYDVLNYIINRRFNDVDIYKDSLTVLDLEPCLAKGITENDIYEWCDKKIKKNKIKVVHMTSSEFIGKTEKLSEVYDLIYIGMRTDTMNKRNGYTVYNDPSLNKKIYLHTGDQMICDARLGGILSQDYVGNNKNSGRLKRTSTYRYSGNDITLLKKKELITYVKNGYPVIVDDTAYDGNKVNWVYIDDTSNMYEFLKTNLPKDKPNVITRSNISSNKSKMAKLLMVQKLSIIPDSSVWPVQYNGNYNDSTKKFNPTYLPSNGGKYYLDFKFKIANIAALAGSSETYTVELFVDRNNDGRYVASEKESKITVTQDGFTTARSAQKLKANTEYRVKYRIDTSYTGLISYKLVITQNSNEGVTTSYIGYSAIKSTTKKKLRILQIIKNEYTRNNNNEALRYVDLSVLSTKKFSGNSMYDYLKNVNDFEFEFVTIKVKEFVAMYADKWNDYNSVWGKSELQQIKNKLLYEPRRRAGSSTKMVTFDGTVETSRLMPYDMIVMGFSDEFSDIGSEDALKDLLLFADSGKSLLFSHDTTSFFNVPYGTAIESGAKYQKIDQYGSYGYYMNTILRDRVAMDRYGVTIQENKNLSQSEKESILAKRDKAYKPGNGTNGTKTKIQEIQGYTNLPLDSYGDPAEDNKYGHPQYGYYTLVNALKGNAYAKVTRDSIPQFFKNRVTQVNEGRITKYPYDIPKDFQCSETHGQYYQLEMEKDDDGDGQSDLIVWYCMSDYENGKGIYSCHPNDVRNSYYIYTVDNITYSGLGHKQLSSETEARLFVNTFVAAYRPIKSDATIEVKDAMKVSEDQYYMYLDMDMDDDFTNIASASKEDKKYYQKVEFVIKSSTLKTLDCAAYNINGEGNETTFDIYDDTNKKMPSIGGGSHQLKIGETYHIYVPKNVLDDVNSYPVSIQYGPDICDVIFLRRNLFNLS